MFSSPPPPGSHCARTRRGESVPGNDEGDALLTRLVKLDSSRPVRQGCSAIVSGPRHDEGDDSTRPHTARVMHCARTRRGCRHIRSSASLADAPCQVGRVRSSPLQLFCDKRSLRGVSREQKMLARDAYPESCITEYTVAYEDDTGRRETTRRCVLIKTSIPSTRNDAVLFYEDVHTVHPQRSLLRFLARARPSKREMSCKATRSM